MQRSGPQRSVGGVAVVGVALLLCNASCNTTLGIEEREFDPAFGETGGGDTSFDDAIGDGTLPVDTSASDAPPPVDTGRADTATPPIDTDAPDTRPPPLDTSPPPVDTSTPDTADASTVRIVFVTSTTTNGNLGGLSGADSRCQTLATIAGLSGSYKAWLSDETTNASDRLSKIGGPYQLVSGLVVAKDWAQLTSGTLSHAINLTEKATAPPVTMTDCATGVAVWTGTDPSGVKIPGGNCTNWTDSGTVARVAWGDAIAVDSRWTRACPTRDRCNLLAAIYCVQQ